MTAPATVSVIFRTARSGPDRGEVTAVFPTCAADYAGREFVVYAHIGQHGAATLSWYWSTRPARPEEYAGLLAELHALYGTSRGPGDPVIALDVRRRFTARHRAEWQANARRARDALRADPSGAPWSAAVRAEADTKIIADERESSR